MRILTILFILITLSGCSKNPDSKPGNKDIPTSTEFKRGESLFFADTKKDSAFYYFTEVTENSKDSLLVAMAYAYLAMLQEDEGDYFGCEESALEGLQHLNEKNPQHFYCLSSLYNELGVSSSGLKNYDASIEYNDLAIQFQQDEAYKKIYLNNKAVAYREKGDYRKAIRLLDSILSLEKDNSLNYARALTNLASLKWAADPSFNPIPQLTKALNIRIKENNKIGISSSFNHISDYYLKYKKDSALIYADKTYRFAKLNNSSEQKLDALKKMILLAPPTDSKKYFTEYQRLNDSIQTARNKAKNQFALIKYQSDKNKTENLLLHKDNTEKELQILRQRVGIYGISFVTLLIFLVFIRWYQKKKRSHKLESEKAIRESQLKTSQKVHDVVANGLYQIMNEIEHKGLFDKESILDKIEHLYEKSRDISYETNEDPHTTEERVNELLSSYATSETKVFIVNNEKNIWEILSPNVTSTIELVLRELFVNMSKHSFAKNVTVRFELFETQLMIFYKDDGVGFPEELKFKNGLKSTENRIRQINGEISFTNESASGLSIKIMIPLSQK